MMLSAPSPKLHYKALFKKDANKAQGCHLLSEALEVWFLLTYDPVKPKKQVIIPHHTLATMVREV